MALSDEAVTSIDGTRIVDSNAAVDIDLGSITSDYSFTARYEPRSVLGSGGMGEVRLYRDRRIGRDVALKIVHAKHEDRPDLQARFLREVRVQGQLEHPSIVPVYDLGMGPDGLFFSMKRVRGMTLETIIAGLKNGDPEITRKFSRRKLLTAISSVGLTLDYAHARGVLHRDLKPGNIMLGDFGEVYVLDWGLAKLTDARDAQPDAQPGPTTATAVTASARVEDLVNSGPTTQTGAILGTPGYMAPEQLTGDPLDARADVYALGAILFEVLTFERLHPKGSLQQVLMSTISAASERTREAARDLPPELQVIWSRATALAPEQRYKSARELVEAIDRFLDGDRDLELRRQTAARHATEGEELARHALAPETSASESTFARSAALRVLGRALALDPANTDASETMARLLVEPPKELPKEAAEELERSTQRTWRVTNHWRAVAYTMWFVITPLVWWLGIHDLNQDFNTIPMLLCLMLSLWMWKAKSTSLGGTIAIAVLSSFAIGAVSRAFGPFMLIPSLLALNTQSFAIQPIGKWRYAAIALGVLGLLVPVVLEAAGVVSPSYLFEGGKITIVPHLLDFPELPATLFLTMVNAWMVIVGSLIVGGVRDELYRSEERLHRYTWQLRQLAPDHPELSPR